MFNGIIYNQGIIKNIKRTKKYVSGSFVLEVKSKVRFKTSDIGESVCVDGVCLTLIKILKNKIKIIDTGIAVAKQTKKILTQYELLNTNQKNKLNLYFQTGESSKINYFLKDQIFKKIIL